MKNFTHIPPQKYKYHENRNELSQAQINQRLKNINLTKRLVSYEKYINAVPKIERVANLRTTWHPETPRFNKNVSLSQWNKTVQQWRKQIHAWGNLREDILQYICSLSSEEKLHYLSNLKLPELSKKEIKNFEKKCGEISNYTMKSILLLSDQIDMISNPIQNKSKTSTFNMKNNNCTDIIERPFLFFPKNFNGKILNSKFIIIKQIDFARSICSIMNNYKKRHKPLYETFNNLYMGAEDTTSSHEENENKTNDIIIHLNIRNSIYDIKDKNGMHKTSSDISVYFENQKKKASEYLHGSNISIKNKSKKNTRKRF